MTENSRLTGDDIFNMAKDGYLYELGMLVQIVKSGYFEELLPSFSCFENFLVLGKGQYLGENLLQSIMEDGRVIDAADISDVGEKLFTCAILVACCEIFGGWTIPVGELELRRTNEYLQMVISHGGGQKKLGRNMAVRLNNGDAVRVVHVLKLLGLIAADTSSYNQLSLGASIGKRDLHAFHVVPYISAARPELPLSPRSPLRFGVKVDGPASIVLIDNDQNLKPVYERMNADGKDRILAMNLDVYEGMDELSEKIRQDQIQPRDLVVAFRLEPKGYPDIARFINCLGRVIDVSADFVATIGSGDNVEDFKHRLDLLHNFEKELIERGMSPFRIKCYQGGTYEEQRANPVFGLNQYASYETLFCKLERDKLI